MPSPSLLLSLIRKASLVILDKGFDLFFHASSIFFLAAPLFIAASATAEGITLINLGSKVEGII